MSQSDSVFDKRIVQRNVAKGIVGQKDVEKYLKSLPDRADNVEITPNPMDDDEGGLDESND